MSHKLISIFIVYLVVYTSASDVRPLVKPPGKLPPPNDTVEDRIINGFTPGRFDNPHVVLLSIAFSQGGAACSGSIIHRNWVLTAGHCAKNAISIQVHLGIYSRTEGAAQIVIVPSNSIFVHPNFINTPSAIANDIALLRLIPGANTGFRQIRPIPYACASSGTFAARIGRACGWGITLDNATDIATVIQCVDLPVITNFECQRTWGGYIRPTNVCTRTVNQRTTCHGDSGGPLAAIDGASQRLKLVGATSFGSHPCALTAPVAFTRVALFESWIKNVSGIVCDRL